VSAKRIETPGPAKRAGAEDACSRRSRVTHSISRVPGVAAVKEHRQLGRRASRLNAVPFVAEDARDDTASRETGSGKPWIRERFSTYRKVADGTNASLEPIP
jgi:hypothetical protein